MTPDPAPGMMSEPSPGPASDLTAAPLLPASFYERSTDAVARDLLGRFLWRRFEDGVTAGGRIVETEAYFGPDDPGSHARRRTPRSEIMYGPPGRAYIYFTYGMHFCLNAVAHEPGRAGAVLLRALEPFRDLEGMARRRGDVVRRTDGGIRERLLCSGPARLTRSLGIGRDLNGTDLRGPILWIAGAGEVPEAEVTVTARIGLSDGCELPARFIVTHSPYLSR